MSRLDTLMANSQHLEILGLFRYSAIVSKVFSHISKSAECPKAGAGISSTACKGDFVTTYSLALNCNIFGFEGHPW